MRMNDLLKWMKENYKEAGAAVTVAVLTIGGAVSPFPGNLIAIGLALVIAHDQGWLHWPKSDEE